MSRLSSWRNVHSIAACRKILDGIFEVCGVAEDMFRYYQLPVCCLKPIKFKIQIQNQICHKIFILIHFQGASAVLLTNWTRHLGRRYITYNIRYKI